MPIETADGRSSLAWTEDVEDGHGSEEARIKTNSFVDILEHAPFGVFVLDSEFRIAQLNPAAQNGAFRNVQPAAGRNFAEAIRIIWPEPTATEVIAIFRRTLESGEPYRSAGFQNPRNDVESTEAYEWEVHPITLADGQRGVICYYYDSTRVREAEHSLRDSEERLRLATEVAGLGIWHWYPDSDRAIWENERMFEILGRLREEGAAGSAEFLEKIIYPEDAEAFRLTLSDAVESGKCFFFQGRIVRRDGQLRWIEFSGQPDRRRAGQERRMIGTVVDVTERKRAEEAQRQNNERAEFVADATDVGFWFCDLPFDKLIWDKRVKSHFWLPADAEVTIQIFYERLHPDDREATRKAIEESIANNGRYEIEYRTMAADGRYKWIRATGRTSYDSAGTPIRFDGITVDITEHKQAEDALKRSEEQFRVLADSLQTRVHERTADLEKKTVELLQKATLLDLANDAILVRDAEGNVAYWNKGAERLYGWSSSEVRGRSTYELLRTKFPVPLSEIMQADRWEGELHQRKKDDSAIIVVSRWTTLRDNKGTAYAWLEINTDITGRKQAEEAARRFSGRILSLQDEERRRIARGLHDSLGQYLTAVRMTLDMFPDADPKQAPVVAECSNLVDKCLAETRTISHLLHPPLLDEAGFRSAARWFVDGFAQRSGVKVNLDLPPAMGRLGKNVETVLFRVMQEALTNVHRHSGAASVNIRLQVESEQVRLEISDDGRGMPQDRLRRVLEAGSGTGVGVAGMRERVREVDGTLDIESSESGTSLRVTIPTRG